jgi:hypothetical protein
LYLTGGMVRAGMFLREKEMFEMFEKNKQAIERFMLASGLDRVYVNYSCGGDDGDDEIQFFRKGEEVECPQGRINFIPKEGDAYFVAPATAFRLCVDQVLELTGHEGWKSRDEWGEVVFLCRAGKLILRLDHRHEVTVTQTSKHLM